MAKQSRYHFSIQINGTYARTSIITYVHTIITAGYLHTVDTGWELGTVAISIRASRITRTAKGRRNTTRHSNATNNIIATVAYKYRGSIRVECDRIQSEELGISACGVHISIACASQCGNTVGQ